MNDSQIWFVTGASKGLGLSLVKQLLAKNYKVAATSRKAEDLIKTVGEANDNFLPLTVNLQNEESVADALAQTVKQFGRLNVVVNNAGYGQLGALEELSDAEARANFEVNVFGALNVIRKVMPYLREQRSGHILNIASVGGFTGNFAGWGIYCATKFAMHGFSESLAAEAKPLGVNVTVVSPGYFRTNFLSSGSMGIPAHEIEAYQEVRASQQAHQQGLNGNQPNDPEKGVAALIKLAQNPNPPVHLFLGQDAYDMAYQKMDMVKQEMEAFEALGTGTGF